jgi:hypothetical protein
VTEEWFLFGTFDDEGKRFVMGPTDEEAPTPSSR